MKTNVNIYIKALFNILTAIAIFLIILFVLPKVIVFFIPFVIGWIISLIATPIVKFLEEKLKIKRKAGSAIVIVLVLAIVIAITYGICYFLVVQAIGFIKDFPSIWASICLEFEKMGNSLSRIYAKLPGNAQSALDGVIESSEKYFSSISFGSTKTEGESSAIGSLVSGIPDVIMGIVMALLSSYLFVSEKDYVGNTFRKYLPKSAIANLDIIKRSVKNAIGGYLKAQLKIEFWIYLVTTIGLLIIHIEYAVVIALFVCFMDFLPVFGAGAVMIPWALFKIFDKDYKLAIGLLIIWGLGQLIRDIIQPKIVGDSVGLSPIPTLFLLFLGYKFMGVAGMIIAIPGGIILKNLYVEGAFDTTLKSMRILIAGFNDYRQL